MKERCQKQWEKKEKDLQNLKKRCRKEPKEETIISQLFQIEGNMYGEM